MRTCALPGIAAMAIVSCLAAPVVATAETGPRQVWTQLALQARTSPQTTVSLELQKRWEGDLDANRVVVRPIVLVTPRPWVALGGGYNYQTGSDATHPREHRWFEHLQLTLHAGPWSLQPRMRLEERFIEGVDGMSVRLRVQGRALRTLGTSPWAAVLSHEVQVTLNETDNGPRQGLDRHRTTAGVQRRLADGWTIETSYLLQTVARTDADYRFDSNLFMNLTRRF